jgi:2-amino-4-hydroxy-6-hydroxymethyldihydropteridine diphosphokinase
VRIGIALGSNLGDRAAALAAAKDFVFSLNESPGQPLCSGIYETEPVDCAPETAPFLNAVAEISVSLPPGALLGRLREFEQSAGRAANHEKNSPREIDLDLLYVGDLHLDTPALALPHPRMTARRFVLQPLADIRPDLVLPGEIATVAALLARLPDRPAVRLVDCAW